MDRERARRAGEGLPGPRRERRGGLGSPRPCDRCTARGFPTATWPSSIGRTPSRVCSRTPSARASIPYLIVGGVRFYERREIKDIVAYLRLAVNPRGRRGLSPGPSRRRAAGWARPPSIHWPTRGAGPAECRCSPPAPRYPPTSPPEARPCPRRLRPSHRAPGPSGGRRSPPLARLHRRGGRLPRAIATPSSCGAHRGSRQRVSRTSRSSWAASEEFGVTQELGWVEASASRLSSTPIALVADVDSLDDDAEGCDPHDPPLRQGVLIPAVFLTGMEEGVFPHSRSMDDAEGAGGGAPPLLRRPSPGPSSACGFPTRLHRRIPRAMRASASRRAFFWRFPRISSFC